MCVCVCVWVCVCECIYEYVCVRKRESGNVCVCVWVCLRVCVCEKARERECMCVSLVSINGTFSQSPSLFFTSAQMCFTLKKKKKHSFVHSLYIQNGVWYFLPLLCKGGGPNLAEVTKPVNNENWKDAHGALSCLSFQSSQSSPFNSNNYTHTGGLKCLRKWTYSTQIASEPVDILTHTCSNTHTHALHLSACSEIHTNNPSLFYHYGRMSFVLSENGSKVLMPNR